MSGTDGALKNLARAMSSWRTAAVALLSFASGLPLGLVWYAIPDWMRSIGVEHPHRRSLLPGAGAVGVQGPLVAVHGSLRAAVLGTAPRVDGADAGRARGPEPRARGSREAIRTRSGSWARSLSRSLSPRPRRTSPTTPTPSKCCVRTSKVPRSAPKSRSIALPCWCREASRSPSRGAGAGRGQRASRDRLRRHAPNYLARSEPEEKTEAPETLREAVWHPFIGFLARHRALEILAFVFLYKFADQLAQALTRPFLIDMGYDSDQRGVALSTIGMVATIAGAFIGGWVTTLAGLGHSLWVFGLLQIFSNVGYFILAGATAPSLPLMYAAHELRAPHVRHGDGSVLGPSPAHDAEEVLGDSVRSVLEPLRAPSPSRRAHQRLRRRCHRLADVLPVDPGDGDPRARDARAGSFPSA